MRPVQRQDALPAHPHKCIICGHGVGPYREFFIDLGFDVAAEYQAIREGAVYLCNLDAAYLADGIIKILNDHANQVMDDKLVKEEASFGIIDRIAERPVLSGVSEHESSRSLLERISDRGTLQGVGPVENLPDTHFSSSPPADSGLDAPASSDDPDVIEPTDLESPTFVMGERVDRTNRPRNS